MSTDLVQEARQLITGLQTGMHGKAQIDRLVRGVAAAQRGASPEESAAALVTLSEGLEIPNTYNAGIAARVIGAMIEADHDPRPVREPMLGCLRRIVPPARELANVVRPQIGEPPPGVTETAAARWVSKNANDALRRSGERMPEAADAWARLQAVWPGAIAVLSVDPEGRAQASDLLPLAVELQDLHEAAGWLTAMLSVLHEEPFVAIEPATGLGIEGRMSGIADNFQLHILLMDAVPWSGTRRVPRSAVATARGQGPQQPKDVVERVWNLYTYQALRPSGTLPDPAAGDEIDEAGGTLIWDEGMPILIPKLDGHRVVLLGPPTYERSWRVHRMFSKLPAHIEREVLDEQAVASWLEKIRDAAAAG